MNYLPVGNSYTGIDFLPALTEQAEKLLKEFNINGEIIKCDFMQCNFKHKFDIVICQSFLRHIGNSKAFIQKMIAVTVNGGLGVCIDTNRELECCGLYINGMDYGEFCEYNGAIKHWKSELKNSERDYAAAMRSAYIMRELGVLDIAVRMCDKVSFICPEQNDYDIKINDFIASKSLWYSNAGEAAERLINHGMTRNEAENYIGKTQKICEYLKENIGEAAFTRFKGKTITYSWKRVHIYG